MSKIAVIYYSASGHLHTIADALAKGAAEGGAAVRLRRVAELAVGDVIRRQNTWRPHYAQASASVQEAALEDLEWADGFALGSPTRYGLPAGQLKEFIDQTGPLWAKGQLANKVATSFTSTSKAHGGQESTLLALNNIYYQWGSIIVPPGYTPQVQYAADNLYGTSYSSGRDGDLSVSTEALAAAHHQGYRLAQYASLLAAGKSPAPSAGSGGSSDPPAAPSDHRFSAPLPLDPHSPPAPFAWQARVASV